jgi:hypothetical protein
MYCVVDNPLLFKQDGGAYEKWVVHHAIYLLYFSECIFNNLACIVSVLARPLKGKQESKVCTKFCTTGH